jgi:hypothetical protein
MVEAGMLVGAVLAVVGVGVGNQDGRRPEGSHKICNDAQPRWRGEEWSRIVVEAPALGARDGQVAPILILARTSD